MSHIIYNGFYLAHPYSGLGVFTRELLRSLLTANTRVTVLLYRDQPTPDFLPPQVTILRSGHLPGRLGILTWEYFWVPKILQQYPDAHYCSPYSHPLPPLTRTGKILMVQHDALFFSESSYTKKLSRRMYQHAIRRTILRPEVQLGTVSHFSAQEIKKAIAYPDDIIILHNGIEHLHNETLLSKEEIQERFQIHGDYLFYHGGYDQRKNVETMVHTLQPLLSSHNVTLVLGGGKLHNTSLYHLPHEKHNVINTGFIDNSTLRSLYHHAKIFLAPSSYEGFNINIGEALMEGTPVLMSAIPVHTEVWGNYATATSFSNSTQLEQAIVSTLSATHKKKSTPPYTWNALAKKVLEYFRK